MTDLLEPMTLRGRTFRNRAWVPPMCMYSVAACDGVPTDFHLMHYGARVAGGFGLVTAEATAVCPEGRISPQDLGLWSDDQTPAFARIADLAHSLGGAFGVQLAHAGRKASTFMTWPGSRSGSVPQEEGGWPTVAPSPLAFPGLAEPHELDADGLAQVVADFAAAAGRAAEAGLDAVQLHAAHGYLLHQFLSPLSNQRSDSYGGSLENRMRLTLEVTEAVRAVWPEDRPLMVRLSATDWLDGGWDVTSSVALGHALVERGVDLIDVSTGGLAPARIPLEPGYQVPYARELAKAGLPVSAVGLITSVEQAQAILDAGDAQAIHFGREALRDPALPLHLARERGTGAELAPPAYDRAFS